MSPLKKTSLIALLAAWLIAVTACSTVSPTALPPVQNSPTHTPSAQGLPTRAAPVQVVPGLAHVDSIQILVLESFPVQIRALVRGWLTDTCTTISEIAQTREGSAFRVTISTVRPTDKVCAQSVVPFEETIALPVAGLQAGEYTVTVNGRTTTFRLSVDNVAPARPEPGRVISGEARVSRVEVRSTSGDASSLTIVLFGDLPDGCTTIARVSHTVEGQVLRITAVTKRPADLMCTQALVPFEQAIEIDAANLPTGTITVIAGGAKATFERP